MRGSGDGWVIGGVCLVLLPLLAGCRGDGAPAAAGSAVSGPTQAGGGCPPCPASAPQAELTRRFLDEQTPRYQAALARARQWLDALQVDPVELRRAGVKGKKKLVELLDVYVRLYQLAPAGERAALLARLRQVAAPIDAGAGWHDLATVDDQQFKQDATSYLRAAYLLDRVGLDTTAYRRQIEAIKPRLDAHLAQRGPHQRLAFHDYYRHFGLREPFPLDAARRGGVIAARIDPYQFRSKLQAYDLTHEVFVPYEFGEKLDHDFFDADERAYLRRALERLTVQQLMTGDVDLAAELLSCLRYLRMTDSEVFREGIDVLLRAQRPEGKWGSYERQRPRYGAYLDQALYLHTTAVALDALTVTFARR